MDGDIKEGVTVVIVCPLIFSTMITYFWQLSFPMFFLIFIAIAIVLAFQLQNHRRMKVAVEERLRIIELEAEEGRNKLSP
jgi:uncharacterized protein (DUF983 family)